MHNTKVKEMMTANPVFIASAATLSQAATRMKDIDCGILPVGTKNKVLGVITDRDIVIRAIAFGKEPLSEKVGDYMTQKIYACSEDDYLEDAAQKMRVHKVSRLLVKDKSGKVTGILSFGGILRKTASADDVANVIKHAVRKAAA